MKNSVTIALAQIPIANGNLEGNLESHVKAIEQSHELNADVVVFPELSLTGYELNRVSDLALATGASNFKVLSQAAADNDIIVIAGCPLIRRDYLKPAIGAVICFPDTSVQFYFKQYLHEGEDKYYSCGIKDYFFTIKGHRIGLAICADFNTPEHALRASKSGADVYVASALISGDGFGADSKVLSNIALTHHMPVLLCNHIANTGGWKTCGKSSVWDSLGECILSASEKKSDLLLCTLSGNRVEAATLY